MTIQRTLSAVVALLIYSIMLMGCKYAFPVDACLKQKGELIDGEFWTFGEQELRDATARFFVDFCNEFGYECFAQRHHVDARISLKDAISSRNVPAIVDLFYSDNLFWNATWGDPDGSDRRWWQNWAAKGYVTAFRAIEKGGDASVILLICYGKRDGYHNIYRNEYKSSPSARDNYFQREIIHNCGMFDRNFRLIGYSYGSETVGDICAKGVRLYHDVDEDR